MALEIRQQLRLTQQLKLTPQLQQAIKLLQLSRMELVDMVRQEMEENPVLEEQQETERERVEPAQGEEERPPDMGLEGVDNEPHDPDRAPDLTAAVDVASPAANNEMDWDAYLEHYQTAPPLPSFRGNSEEAPSLESTYTRKASLADHLAWQLRMQNLDKDQERVGLLIIGNIDASGYLREPPLEEIARTAGVSLEVAEAMLLVVQNFDPVGVGARTLEECLLLQAKHANQDDEIVTRMIKHHMANLERKNYPAIAKDLGQPLDEIIEAVKVIAGFDPKPGRVYSEEEPIYIVPDVYVHKVGDKYFVVPNDDGLPKLKISGFYRQAMSTGPRERQYVQEKLRSAQWLIRSIQQRQRTIIRVTESIIKFQQEFFDKGVAFLRPLILRDVAEDISMHESTISRVTTSKYVHTPQGIFELKYFFNSGINRVAGEDIASESVKQKIKDLIGGENARHPLSDQRLVELLREQNIDIARRTVAKYREQLNILSSSKRRQLY